MKHYIENDYMIYKFKGKLHDKIILSCTNFRKHIRNNHPEISLNKIETILEKPDYVYKPSYNSKVFYYERKFGKNKYRIVIDKYDKGVKNIVTAYKIINDKEFLKKRTYCVYDLNEELDFYNKQKDLEENVNYFYQLFGITE